MKNVKLIKVFVSCPGDIVEELDSIKLIFNEINKTSGSDNNYRLEFINWDLDVYTGIGEDGQDVINTQMEGKYDILLAIIWKRMGTPTARAKSGTKEEINKAINEKLNGKPIELMIYFKTSSPSSLNDINLEQLKEVSEFKASLIERGVLYKDFDSVNKFDSLLRVNISRLISEQILSKDNLSRKIEPQFTSISKYSEIENILNKPDSSEASISDDLYESSLQVESSFNLMNDSITSISTIIWSLGSIMSEKTREIDKANLIKDTRLKQKKGSAIINALAIELSDINTRLGVEVPIFKEHLNDGLNSYSKLLLAFKDYQLEENMTATIELRNSIETATRGSANMLQSMIELPPFNHRLNESKRLTVAILKELTRELLNGLTLLDELTE